MKNEVMGLFLFTFILFSSFIVMSGSSSTARIDFMIEGVDEESNYSFFNLNYIIWGAGIVLFLILVYWAFLSKRKVRVVKTQRVIKKKVVRKRR